MMLKKFLSFIDDHQLFQPEDKIILAVSGGADSIAMAHLFHEAKFNIAIAHCNFKLRGKESDEDEAFVKKFAKKWKVPFFNATFPYNKMDKTSVQLFARTKRYAWFYELLKEHGYNYIATAHHQNDVVETVLFNLVRGTGIAGLHGILKKQNQLIRPMLFTKKEEITAYLKKKKISWREDSSNAKNDYSRNLIRNKAVPHLKKINPTLEETIYEATEKLAAIEDVFKEAIQNFEKNVTTIDDKQTTLNIKSILKEKNYTIKLTHLLKKYGFTFSKANTIIQALTSQSGKLFYSETDQLLKDRENLILTPIDFDRPSIYTLIEEDTPKIETSDFTLYIERKEIKNNKITSSPETAFLDYEKLHFPLILRSWNYGDKFQPLGMTGKKKISDWLIDKKIPRSQKDKICVLLSNSSICWLVGQQIDERYKLTEETKWVLKMAWKKR